MLVFELLAQVGSQGGTSSLPWDPLVLAVPQTGTLALTAGILVYLIRTTIPKLVEDFRVSVKELANAFREEMKTERDAHAKETDRLMEHIEKIERDLHS